MQRSLGGNARVEMFIEGIKGVGLRARRAFAAGEWITFYPMDLVTFRGVRYNLHPELRTVTFEGYEAAVSLAREIFSDGEVVLREVLRGQGNVLYPYDRWTMGLPNMFGHYINDPWAPGDTEARYLQRAERLANVVVETTSPVQGEPLSARGWVLYKSINNGQGIDFYTLQDAVNNVQAFALVRALRPIAAGEVLALAYGWEYWA